MQPHNVAQPPTVDQSHIAIEVKSSETGEKL